MIQLRALTKAYGDGASRVDALKGVDLDIAAGEFVSIMGPSGSGKSTLLNLVSALDIPTSGQVKIDDLDIGSLTDDSLTLFRRRRIGLIFQFFHLLPTLTALDNVLLPVMLDGSVGDADRARARAMLSEVGLGQRTAHRLHQLSGGEMQRVAIARALILQPKLLLADEPTGNLDSTTGRAVLALLRQLCQQHRATIVMVTHDPNAAGICDRVVTLRDGRITHDQRARERPEAFS